MSDTTIDQPLPHEVALLNVVAWLAPDPIPRWLLVSTNAETIWHEIVSQQFTPAEPIGSLGSSIEGLVRRTVLTETVAPDAFSISEGYRELTRNRQEQPVVWLMFALRLLHSVIPIDESQPEWERLHPHILYATQQGDFYKISEPTSELMSALASWLISRSSFEQAEPLQRRALQFDDWNYGSHSLRVARCCGNLAQILSATRRPFEASLFQQRATTIENCFDSDEPVSDGSRRGSGQEFQTPKRFVRAEFLSRSPGEVFRDPLPMMEIIRLHGSPPEKGDRNANDEHPTDQTEPDENSSGSPEIMDDGPPEIVDEEPIRRFSLTPSLYPPIAMEEIPRYGRILFAYRCLLRSEEPLDCLSDNRHAVAVAISSILNVLQLTRKEPVPTRSDVYDLIRDCVEQKKAASLQMEFDRSVAIQNVIRFLVSLDYAMGIIRAKERRTSTAFAELVAVTTAITKSHREAQEFDLRALRNAIELYGTGEYSQLPRDVLGKLWPHEVD